VDRAGERFVHATDDATDFVRRLLAQHGDVEDLEVRRASLEDTYLEMVRRQEHPHRSATGAARMEVVR
jgi:ABC-2 type transport system ATP-binding protein